MSDFEKLRKKYASLWLIASFALFALAISGVWSIFVFIHNFFSFFFVICVSMFFFVFTYFAVENFYKYFIGVSEEKISESASAKLKKLKGILFLIAAFVALGLATNCIWGIFVFGKNFEIFAYLILAFFALLALFSIFIVGTYNNFAIIEEIFSESN